ncbi:hypothetical protein [Spirulina major]|nr:hypothetical protein [Spirulina major]
MVEAEARSPLGNTGQTAETATIEGIGCDRTLHTANPRPVNERGFVLD